MSCAPLRELPWNPGHPWGLLSASFQTSNFQPGWNFETGFLNSIKDVDAQDIYKDGSPITYVVLGPKAPAHLQAAQKKGITPHFIHQSTSVIRA